MLCSEVSRILCHCINELSLFFDTVPKKELGRNQGVWSLMIPILNGMFDSCLDTMGKTGQCRWPSAFIACPVENSCIGEATVDTVCIRKVFHGFVSFFKVQVHPLFK